MGNGEFLFTNSQIFRNGTEITCEEFYKIFTEIYENTWFVKYFILAYKDKNDAIPASINEFAMYMQFTFLMLPYTFWK